MATANFQSMTASSKGPQTTSKKFHGRLKVDAQFCPTDVEDLFATVDWEVRSSQIKGENGELIFEQTNCEVPSFWSQLATNVICSKYFYGEVGTSEREYSVKQLVHRVARTIADWGLEDGYFASPADVDTTFKQAVEAGATGITEPRDEFWGARFAVFGDPFGHRWLLNAALEKK